MNKKRMQRRIESLVRQVAGLEARRGLEAASRETRFRVALKDLTSGDVTIVTANGHLLHAVVVNVEISRDAIPAGSTGGWVDFVPGHEEISVHLSPLPNGR